MTMETKTRRILEDLAAVECTCQVPRERGCLSCRAGELLEEAVADERAARDPVSAERHEYPNGKGHRVMVPWLLRTRVRNAKTVVLALDNGVRIESGGLDGVGGYVLVANREGMEIGYWNAEEWMARPESTMREILVTACLGCPAALATGWPSLERWVSPQSDENHES